MKQTELWKDITIRSKKYRLSNHGIMLNELGEEIVFSVKPGGLRYKNFRTKTGIKTMYLHKLVAKCFLNENGAFVRHIDGDRGNNNVENLTYSNNRK